MPVGQSNSQIGNALQLAVAGLGIALNSTTVSIELRLKLEPDDNFAVVPLLVVAPQGKTSSKRIFGSTHRVVYPWVVALVTPGRQDFSGQIPGELQTALDALYSLVDTLREPQALGLTFVMDVEIDAAPPLDKAFVEKGLNVSAVQFGYVVMEG